jgi:hypothetical protein
MTLAILRLRRREFADVESLCGPVLALKDFPPSSREIALAIVLAARQELGQPHEDVFAKAAALNRNAEAAIAGIREIVGLDARNVLADIRDFKANPGEPVQPERTNRLIAAYRAGDLTAKASVGDIAAMLRTEGRLSELLELHAGIEMPFTALTRSRTRSMASLEWHVLLVPSLTPDVYELAATRVQWVLDNGQFDGQQGTYVRAAVRHTLALARLRQGRFGEVEPLCQEELDLPGLPSSNRATILATIVLARRALGQPYADLLAEAQSVAPKADLVGEASEGLSR